MERVVYWIIAENIQERNEINGNWLVILELVIANFLLANWSKWQGDNIGFLFATVHYIADSQIAA